MFGKKAAVKEKKESMSDHPSPTAKKGKKTIIRVNYDIGFPNVLYLRGSGGNLSWERGVPMTNIKSDEWIWESDLDFGHGEFKVVINDIQFEAGENHPIKAGATISYSPAF